MDPITAIQFASSIISFIDFSWTLVKGTYVVYQSTDGATADQADLSVIVGDLQSVTRTISVQPPSQEDGPHWKELKFLALRCHEDAQILLDILDALKRKEGNKLWRSLETKWKSMRKEKEVSSLEHRLNDRRLQILLRLNLILQ